MDFVSNKCHVTGKKEAKTYTEDLYRAYCAYCEKEKEPCLCEKEHFSKLLGDLYSAQLTRFRKRDDSQNLRGFYGIRLIQKPMTFYRRDDDDFEDEDYELVDDDHPQIPTTTTTDPFGNKIFNV